MNTPETTPQFDLRDALFLTVRVNDGGLLAPMFPPNNPLATQLMGRYLAASLAVKNLLRTEPLYGGNFNCSVYLFPVHNCSAAACVIIDALTRAEWSLLSLAKLYRHDEGEGIMRCLHPENGDAAKLPELVQHIKDALAESARWAQFIAEARRKLSNE